MNRKRLLIHLVTLTSVVLLVIIASGIGLHVYANGRLRRLNLNSGLTPSQQPPLVPPSVSTSVTTRVTKRGEDTNEAFIWNKASSSGNLEVEERFIVEDLLPTMSSTSTKSNLVTKSSTTSSIRKFNYQRPSTTSRSTRTSTSLSVSSTTERNEVDDGDDPSLPPMVQVEPEVAPPLPFASSPTPKRQFTPKNPRSSSSYFPQFPRGGVNGDPVGEVRSAPIFIQSRPVYSKPSPKPKLLLKPPQQLLKNVQSSENNDDGPSVPDDVERITQTVYGFLDFVTTIGNTVMIFTPQTKKVTIDAIKPTLTSEIAAITVKPTKKAELAFERSNDENLVSTSSSSSSPRQPKQIILEEEPSAPTPVIIESSEVEPQLYGSTITAQVAPPLDAVNFVPEDRHTKKQHQIIAEAVIPSPSTPEVNQQIRTQVNVVASSPNLDSGEFIEGETLPEEVIPSTTSQSKISSKGFTLKLTPKHHSPVLVTPASSAPIVVTAQKVNLPPPPPPKPVTPAPKKDEPTGVINQIYETQVNDGKTTVVETKIIGTYIGSQYARILESTSSVLPNIEVTKSISLPSTSSPSITILAQKAPTTTTTTTTTTNAPSTSTSTTPASKNAKQIEDDAKEEEDDDEEERLSEDLPGEQEEDGEDEQEVPAPSSSTLVVIEPTPTASEEQTHYILPQKEKKAEKIYVSPVPGPNAYSRQPQLYVDINPAKSAVDVIVTATPTRGKPFRLSNRFSNRLNKNQAASADSNELTQAQEPTQPAQEESSRRSSSRFGRNRGRAVNSRPVEESVPTVSVYSHVVSATPTRRFKSGGARTSSRATKEVTFKTAQAGRGFNPSTRQLQQVVPTSSSSIYRFKLNRPTGRWRFKPSPKPKVNIIKTKDEEELEEGQEPKSEKEITPTNGPVYLQNLEAGSELQHPEETRNESNELVQEIEPELVPQTIRVSTVTPTDFSDLDKYLEIATIKSPYVFQAGNVKNTRYITVTKTFTKESIQPTLSSSVAEATLENILATKPPYEKILEGSSDVATLPVISLNGDMATPPLETITQSFSTTQLMLKTSILPVLYDGVTTLYTLTQSYFITRLVTAHKTVPPVELFQFVPTKSLTEFNTALQEAGSEHRDHLLGSESEDENDTNYEHILAPPDELTSVGSDFDPSSMDEKIPKQPISREGRPSKDLIPRGKSVDSSSLPPNNPFAQPSGLSNSITDPFAGLAGLTPEQLAFIRYFTAQNQQQPQQSQPQPQSVIPQTPVLPNSNLFPQLPQAPPTLPQAIQPQFSVVSSSVVVDTTATVVETKTLRLLFGAKPTYTVLYSTKVVPTRMTTYVTTSIPVKPTAAIQNPFLNALPFPLAYVG